MTRILNAIRIAFSNLVLAAKKRAGFRTLEWVDGVTGVVVTFEVSEDGDTCFDLLPDPEFLDLLDYSTAGTLHHSYRLHCEVVPADRERLAQPIAGLRAGVRVKVTGFLAWDGAHHGKGLLFDVLMVLLGAAPTVDGWLEIHPVRELEVVP